MRKRVLAAVGRAVEEVNRHVAAHDRLLAEEAELILADGTRLDSLGFVSLVVAIEMEVSREFGRDYSLLAHHDPSPDNPVFGTLGSLASGIARDLEGSG